MEIRRFLVGTLSERGLIKSINQDRILMEAGGGHGGEYGLFAIADGLGGFAAGEVASAIAIRQVENWWKNSLPVLLKEQEETRLQQMDISLQIAVRNANKEILEYSQGLGARMGTTLSVLFIYKNQYIIKHIGDSRIYKMPARQALKLEQLPLELEQLPFQLEQLTEDHSWVARQMARGHINKNSIRFHPRRNLLTQCIGIKENIELHEVGGSITPGDVFILCSDGFYNLLNEDEIISAIQEGIENDEDPKKALEILSALVKKRGERDNISVMLVTQQFKKQQPFLYKLKDYLFKIFTIKQEAV